MATYYYLISSLPMLRSDGSVPISYPKFLEMCASSVSASVYRALENLDLMSGEGPLLSEWSRSYSALMCELAYQRKLRLGKPAKPPEDRDASAVSAAAAALNAPNPLEAERLLLAQQFRLVDSLVGMHYFDEYALFGYAVKLKLLERLRCFRYEDGKEEFKSLFDSVQQRILSL